MGTMDPGRTLADARRTGGLTQAQLARRLGTTQPAVAKLERAGANPTVRTLDRALRACGHRLELLAPRLPVNVDVTLIDDQLALSPANRLRMVEQLSAQARMLAIAGARSRGELP
jgi:transcriptional regulator with XRE-family HTH domain